MFLFTLHISFVVAICTHQIDTQRLCIIKILISIPKRRVIILQIGYYILPSILFSFHLKHNGLKAMLIIPSYEYDGDGIYTRNPFLITHASSSFVGIFMTFLYVCVDCLVYTSMLFFVTIAKFAQVIS